MAANDTGEYPTIPAGPIEVVALAARVGELEAKVRELKEALNPFAALVVFIHPRMADSRAVSIGFVPQTKPVGTPDYETGESFPAAFTAGDIRRAASARGIASAPRQPAALKLV